MTSRIIYEQLYHLTNLVNKQQETINDLQYQVLEINLRNDILSRFNTYFIHTSEFIHLSINPINLLIQASFCAATYRDSDNRLSIINNYLNQNQSKIDQIINSPKFDSFKFIDYIFGVCPYDNRRGLNKYKTYHTIMSKIFEYLNFSTQIRNKIVNMFLENYKTKKIKQIVGNEIEFIQQIENLFVKE
jgi:hypothetical protein